MQRVFLADHDPFIAESIAAGLAELGYAVERVHELDAALAAARSARAQVALIEWGRPMTRGCDVVRQLERKRHRWPLLLITDDAAGAPGASSTDCTAAAPRPGDPPFALAQIAERLRLQLDHTLARSRSAPADDDPSTLRVADLEIERSTGRVSRGGRAVGVTRREYLLLEYLALHHGAPVSREEIAREVWHVENRVTPLDNVIDVHIGRLRRKLGAEGRPPLIHTIRGVGYRLSGDSPDHEPGSGR